MEEIVKEEVKPKRSWVKRHKVGVIVGSILLIIVAGIVGFFGYVNAWNEGMGLPPGYGKTFPLTSSTKYSNILLKHQFEEENSPINQIRNKIWFRYGDEIYRLQAGGTSFDYVNQHNIIYKEADETNIGSFFSQTDDDNVWNWYYGWQLFFDDHYIYYVFKQAILRKVYFKHDGVWAYVKSTFFRFDLNTGNNEEINIRLFVEKINIYDETIKIK